MGFRLLIVRIVLAFFIFFGLPACVYSWTDGEVDLSYRGETRTVKYSLSLPSDYQPSEPLTILVCVGGLNYDEGVYGYSDTRECSGPPWDQFVKDYHVAVLGLGFVFDPDDWPKKRSYQYPQAWSGQALMMILDKVRNESALRIRKDGLLLFGISAGAQYVTRFAFLHPEMVRAVAVHESGGFDRPKRKIDTKFLITVGGLDNEPITRLEFAKRFAKLAQRKGIDVQLRIIPGIGHVIVPEQLDMSVQFFLKFLR
jgi:pimeloyl-ACP methyl ester carboxylesterase